MKGAISDINRTLKPDSLGTTFVYFEADFVVDRFNSVVYFNHKSEWTAAAIVLKQNKYDTEIMVFIKMRVYPCYTQPFLVFIYYYFFN